MNKNSIFLVDPMSYSNLGLYDKNLLENTPVKDKVLFGNIKYEHTLNSKFDVRLIYSYSEKSGLRKLISYCNSQLILLIKVIIYKPKIVHFQWFKLPLVDLVLVLLVKLFNSKTQLIFTAHNILPHDSKEKLKLIYSIIYKYVDKIIVHDRFSEVKIIDIFSLSKFKLKVIPHGILEIAKDDLDKNQMKVKLTFAMLGFLSNYKGLDLLIDAWEGSNYLSNNDSINLVIAGDANKDVVKDLERIAKIQNVSVINKYLDSACFNKLLLESDVLILPYREISQSGIMMSGLVYKKAFVVSNTGGLIEPFELGKVGWILEETTVNCLRDKLELICKNPIEVKEIKNNHKLWNSVNEYYSWKKIGYETLSFYMSNYEK
jgi:D-inositol-3-phosphate glycosyltransferase